MLPYYEYRHVVGFEETNVVGNVYFVHHLRWQGRCRELFLRERAPEVLGELQTGLKLVTLAVECEYFGELTALDELTIRMRLAELTTTQLALAFDYVRRSGDEEFLVARGRQRIACVRAVSGRVEPVRVPEPLARALAAYGGPTVAGRAGTHAAPALAVSGD